MSDKESRIYQSYSRVRKKMNNKNVEHFECRHNNQVKKNK